MFDFAGLNLNNVQTIVDVGAGDGTFLGPAIDYYRPSQSLAVEMLPDRANALWSKFPNVVHAAIGEFRGWAEVGRTRSIDSSSLLTIDPRAQGWFTTGPGGMDQEFVDGHYVEVRTLDDVCSHLDVVDLMKVDVQGYEGRLIRGGRGTLDRTRALIIEVLFCHHYEGQSEADEIDGLLIGLGFRLQRYLNDYWSRDHTVHLQGDAYYVNSNV